MYNINEILKDEIQLVNKKISQKYKNILSIDRDNFRELINRQVGSIISMDKLSIDRLKEYEAKGGIVGIDGSVNKKGGSYPHYIELFQAMAKSTIKSQEAIFKAYVLSPVLDQPSREENPLEDVESILAEESKKVLSRIEVEVALESIEKHKPYAIIMDGSLIRYYIYSKEEWLKLREKCEDKGIILVGVIEDIKTWMVGETLEENGFIENRKIYDKELLFGKLNMGEAIEIDDQVNTKGESGYSSMFMRTSLDPNIIGMDILDSQKEHIGEMANLVYTLTPENSRGIPLWLDLIDKEVKISDKLIESLMETYLDRDIYEKFFKAARTKRS